VRKLVPVASRQTLAGSSGAEESGGTAGEFGGADGGTRDPGSSGAPGDELCGNGERDPGEECDAGDDNRADAYGEGLCTTTCEPAGFCGDRRRNGLEACDDGGTGATDQGACNPECTGFYEKKFIRLSVNEYATGLGGPTGADQKCQLEFDGSYKALVVGGGRRATVTPFVGDGQQDWVIRKYTHYYNALDDLVWRTDDVALLGVRDGGRQDLYAIPFGDMEYPWGGWNSDWTTLQDVDAPGMFEGTCNGWTSNLEGWGSFVFNDLTLAASEPCGRSSHVICVQQ